MNCYIFDVRIDCCFISNDMNTLDLLEMGPLNMINVDVLSRVKMAVRDMSSSPARWGWWTDFSSWRDFDALRRNGIRLSMHDVVEDLNQKLSNIDGVSAFVKSIDDNGNLGIGVLEFADHIRQMFTIGAKRRRLRRLKDIGAYNVAQSLNGPDDADELQMPDSLRKSVKSYVLTMAGDYVTYHYRCNNGHE